MFKLKVSRSLPNCKDKKNAITFLGSRISVIDATQNGTETNVQFEEFINKKG